jgi:hypothetical protein
MTTRLPISYIDSDIPVGLTVADWRRTRARSRPARRFPTLRFARAARRARVAL